MKILLFVSILLLPISALSQYCGVDLNKSTGVAFLRKDVDLKQGISKSKKEKLILCKQCLKQENITLKQKAQLSNYIAGTYYSFTNEVDSIDKYINLFYTYDSEWFKEHISKIEYDSQKYSIYKDFFHPYYLLDRDLEKKHSEKYDFDRTVYYNKLDSIAENKNIVPPKNLTYAQELSAIKEKDQKYRGKEITNKSEQATLDFNNRELLDSLYTIYGFPSKEKIGSKVSLTPWLVLQHSTDCEWNEKWLKRHLQAYQNEEKDIGLLPQTFHRFYNQENGYCTQEDKDRANLFIKSLKEDFSEEYQDIFGYRNY